MRSPALLPWFVLRWVLGLAMIFLTTIIAASAIGTYIKSDELVVLSSYRDDTQIVVNLVDINRNLHGGIVINSITQFRVSANQRYIAVSGSLNGAKDTCRIIDLRDAMKLVYQVENEIIECETEFSADSEYAFFLYPEQSILKIRHVHLASGKADTLEIVEMVTPEDMSVNRIEPSSQNHLAAISSGYQIWFADFANQTVTLSRVPGDYSGGIQTYGWSASGQWFVYMRRQDSMPTYKILFDSVTQTSVTFDEETANYESYRGGWLTERDIFLYSRRHAAHQSQQLMVLVPPISMPTTEGEVSVENMPETTFYGSSPDGRFISLRWDDDEAGTYGYYDTTTRQTVQVTPQQGFSYLLWSPDSRFLLVVKPNLDPTTADYIWYDTVTGTNRQVSGLYSLFTQPWSPDSQWIAAPGNDAGTLVLIHVVSGETISIDPLGIRAYQVFWTFDQASVLLLSTNSPDAVQVSLADYSLNLIVDGAPITDIYTIKFLDKHYMAYESTDDLYVVDIRRNRVLRLTDTPDAIEVPLFWLP